MSLRGVAVKGMGVVAGLKIFSAVANQVSNILLAVLLLPTDFGIFAIGFLFVQVIANFSDFGISREIIQRKDQVEQAIVTGASIRLVISVVLLVIGIAIAPLVSGFYAEENITDVMRVVSLIFLFHFLGFIPRVSLARELRFGRIVLPDTVGKLTKSFLAVGLAFLGFSYWSLVIAAIMGNLVGVIGLYISHPWRFRFQFDSQIARELLEYGKFVTSGSLFLFLFHTIDDAIIGKVLGLSLLGSYVIAYTWGVFFPSSLNATLSQVMYPIFSKVKSQASRLRNAFITTTKYSAMISAPICLGMFALAPQFVMIVLGGVKWADAIIPLRLLSFYGLHMVITAPVTILYYAIGQPKQNMRFFVVQLAILLLILYPAIVLYGIVGAAISVLAVGIMMTVWMLWAVSRELRFPLWSLVQVISSPILSSALAASLLILSKAFLETSLPVLLGMILGGACLYLLFMVLLTRGAVLDDIKDIIGILRITRLEAGQGDSGN